MDKPGGVMFPQQAFVSPQRPRNGLEYARYFSRVSGYPEVLGQMPVAALREAIETPGAGQIRALVSIAGNPVVSNPEGDRLAQALESLDGLIAVDIYHNETTRLADVVLPGTSPFDDVHYDSFLGAMTYRNTARYSPALRSAGDQPDEWEVMLRMAYACTHGAAPDPDEYAAYEDEVITGMIAGYQADPECGIAELEVSRIKTCLSQVNGVERVLDLGIRCGPWGDRFEQRDGLTLKQLKGSPLSIDRGELTPRLEEVLGHADDTVYLAPGVLISDLERLSEEKPPQGLRLFGRRNIQTNNSWLHNLPTLSSGPDRAVLEMNRADAQARQIRAGQNVLVESNVGHISVPVVLSDAVMPGTVCMPHGFSPEEDRNQSVARGGANSNLLAAADYVDVPSATVALNGIEVTVRPL
jgi:anaerobic selenocysteine-containing dehydrogenase